ncbi:ATP-binding protein [Paraburkholderia fynbosensis]|uniref:histidine kinase n=1 Tax=Paraburkholderia fynbosensis TaxID=1200993 RepID=A0A6J5FDD5_9BURK|nr:ATP-binding protein [Paraburkholderia fynbosensis]CAB3777818.1 hypothetical protein LMG27177_00458 [Paraburkholderia fynbosensis]
MVANLSDKGIGLPVSQLEHRFEAYVQLAIPGWPVARGLGIGLSVVQNLVDTHGGRVTAASGEVGKCRTTLTPSSDSCSGWAG